jgi:hypothetical protein
VHDARTVQVLQACKPCTAPHFVQLQ